MNYLVQYGLGAFLGRFQAVTTLTRGQRVVVQTPRGVELGTVLSSTNHAAEPLGTLGHVVREAVPNDEQQVNEQRSRIAAILHDAQSQADVSGLPLTFLDGEILFDTQTAIVQAIHWAECNADALLADLSHRHGVTVQLHDLTTAPPPKSGCSTCGSDGGCSSCGTGGGCSSGSCSKGAVKSSADMTAYFAQLRTQMEATKYRVPLH